MRFWRGFFFIIIFFCNEFQKNGIKTTRPYYCWELRDYRSFLQFNGIERFFFFLRIFYKLSSKEFSLDNYFFIRFEWILEILYFFWKKFVVDNCYLEVPLYRTSINPTSTNGSIVPFWGFKVQFKIHFLGLHKFSLG